MLKIDPLAFDKAIQALMIAAKSATDMSGLRVLVDTPRPPEGTVTAQGFPQMNDWPRIRAITLGAIVALVNGPVLLADEVHDLRMSAPEPKASPMTLDDIAVPSNFLGLQAVFRAMLPASYVQRDGAAQPFTDTNELYYEILVGPRESEREAVRAWWQEFVTYAKARGGHEIVWRVRPEISKERDFSTASMSFSIYARLFIAKGDASEAAE